MPTMPLHLSFASIFSKGLLMFTFAALLSLFGCDNQRIQELEEGISTEADVRAKFGEPEKIWDAPSSEGTRILEFNRQPAGFTNYMISIAPDGKMSALRQVLTPQNFAKIEPGMMMEDVRKMLGKPAKITPYALSQQTHYDWRWVQQPMQNKLFTVVFNTDMRVVSTGSTDIQPDGGH
jgi:hypothetical protein